MLPNMFSTHLKILQPQIIKPPRYLKAGRSLKNTQSFWQARGELEALTSQEKIALEVPFEVEKGWKTVVNGVYNLENESNLVYRAH